jgi:hypothetical protein
MKQYFQKHLLKELFIESFNNKKKNLIEDPSAQKIANLPDKLANLDISNLKYLISCFLIILFLTLYINL